MRAAGRRQARLRERVLPPAARPPSERGPRRPPPHPAAPPPRLPPHRAPASHPWAPLQPRGPRARRPRLRAAGVRGGPGRAPRGRGGGVGVGVRRGRGGAAWLNATARRPPGPGLRVTCTASGLARSSIRSLPAACSALGPGSRPRESSRVTQDSLGSSVAASRRSRGQRGVTKDVRSGSRAWAPRTPAPALLPSVRRGRLATCCQAGARRDSILVTSQRLPDFFKKAAGQSTEFKRLVQISQVQSGKGPQAGYGVPRPGPSHLLSWPEIGRKGCLVGLKVLFHFFIGSQRSSELCLCPFALLCPVRGLHRPACRPPTGCTADSALPAQA